jgi:two-component system KDP operon response regulator KdpE
MPLLLIVEDDSQMRKFLRASLSSHGYRLVEAVSGAEALSQAASYNPDMILLDLGLPDLDGLEVTKRLREWATAPIIVLSARGQEDDKIAALDAGADDYLTKPFGTGELLARIRVALRHAARTGQERSEPLIRVGELSIDLDKRSVFAGEKAVHLTPIEYKLLAVLMRNAGKVLTHRQLLKEVWGPGYANNTQYLRVYMVQLRHKLETDPARPRYLVTEAGVGYRLRDEP